MERKWHEEGGKDLKVQNGSKEKTGHKKKPGNRKIFFIIQNVPPPPRPPKCY
jgi:hypothetical protein